MMPDDTLIKVKNEDLSIYIRNGKAITIQKECDEMMG